MSDIGVGENAGDADTGLIADGVQRVVGMEQLHEGVFPAHPVSEVNIMPKPKWNLNII